MTHPTKLDALGHAIRSIQAISGNGGSWRKVEEEGQTVFLSDGTWHARVSLGLGFEVLHIKIQREPFRMGAAL